MGADKNWKYCENIKGQSRTGKSVSYACLNENYFIFLRYRKIDLWDTGIRLVIENKQCNQGLL